MERNIIPTCSNLEATHFGGKSQLLPERHSLPQAQQLRRVPPNDLICFQRASSDTYNQIMCMRIGILILTHGDNSFEIAVICHKHCSFPLSLTQLENRACLSLHNSCETATFSPNCQGAISALSKVPTAHLHLKFCQVTIAIVHEISALCNWDLFNAIV